MVAKSTFAKMDLGELIEARDAIIELIGMKQAEAREEFKTEILQKAAALGIDPAALFGKARSSKANGSNGAKRSEIAAKYRDPANHANVWSGRGRMARWLQHYVAAGKRKEDFLVK